MKMIKNYETKIRYFMYCIIKQGLSFNSFLYQTLNINQFYRVTTKISLTTLWVDLFSSLVNFFNFC